MDDYASMTDTQLRDWIARLQLEVKRRDDAIIAAANAEREKRAVGVECPECNATGLILNKEYGHNDTCWYCSGKQFIKAYLRTKP